MKKAKDRPPHDERKDMLPEYDFTGGVRGKHYHAMREGYTTTVHEADGSTTVTHYRMPPGAVMLDHDVRVYFPDAEAVNKALRGLIALIPTEHRTARKPKQKSPAKGDP